MIKFKKFYVSEAMSRRDFLRFGGRAVAASMAPKSVVSNVVKNVLTGTPAQVFTPMAVSKAAQNLINAGYAMGSGSFSNLRPENTIKYASFLKTNLAFLANALQSKNLGLLGWEKDDPKAGQNFTNGALKELNQILSGKLTFSDITDHNYLDHIASGEITDVMATMYRAGFVTKNLEQGMVKKWGVDLVAGEKFRGLTGKNYFGDDEVEREFEEFKKKHFKKEMEEEDYRSTAYSVGYSRMDKAGGSEDEGYAKYFEKVKRFDHLVEAMNRREFLRTIGKGASIAGLSPDSVGKIAMNLAAQPPESNILTKAISKFLIKMPGVFTDELYYDAFENIEDVQLTLESYKEEYGNILNAFKKSGTTMPPGLITPLNYILEKFAEINGCVDMHIEEPEEYPEELTLQGCEELFFRLSSEEGPQNIFNNNLISYGFKSNHITPAAQKHLEDNYEIYKCDFVNDPASKARKEAVEARREDWMEKHSNRVYADTIDYSRMDRAGSSEDEGYAKYYEKVNFNTLVNLVNSSLN